MEKVKPTILYRYINIHYNKTTELRLHEFPIVKYTERGYWIETTSVGRPVSRYTRKPRRRFILSNATKRFAYEDKSAAFVAYKKRKRSERRHLEARLLKNRDAQKVNPGHTKHVDFASSFLTLGY